MQLPIATGFYEDASKPIAAQECINLIPQIPQTNALTEAQLKFTPGISLFATAGAIARRGEWVMDEIAYEVAGTTLYRVNSDGTTTSLGTITGAGQVSMVDNGTQLCIVVPGSTGYIYTVAGGLVTISDADYTANPSLQVVFKDGYFIHITASKFFISALNDGTAYDALDFAAAEVLPDKITAAHVNRNVLYICGTETIEPFQNIGGEGFPFQRIAGGVVAKGVKGKFSLKDFDNSFLFFGGGHNEQPTIWKFNGGSPFKISTAAIDKIISEHIDSEQDDIYISTYAEEGGFFANAHFKDRVLTYDAAASALSGSPKWHERKSKDVNGLPVKWRVAGIMKAYGVTLVTDNQSGRVGKLDQNIYVEYDSSIRRVVSTQPLHALGDPVAFSEMEIMCEAGTASVAVSIDHMEFTEDDFAEWTAGDPIDWTGPVGPDGSNPFISREFSDDGGYTFSNMTRRSLGLQGQYKRRQVWKREGQANNARVYRFIHDEPIKGAIFGLTAEVEA